MSASAASRARVGAGRRSAERAGRQELLQPAVLRGSEQLVEAADQVVANDDLREAHHPRLLNEFETAGGILGQVDLGELHAAGLEQALHALAERAWIGGVNG